MPERDFELYLDLLGRLLRLRPEQRAEIADELRDHLESRLDELTAAGLSREAAVRRALEEFGDAAGLASHFTNIAREKRRRLIMRCTLGTVAVTAVVLLALSAFWPPDAGINLPGRVAAQDVGDPAAPEADPLPPNRSSIGAAERDETIPEVESKLSKRIAVDFQELPLFDVVEFIGDAIEVDILLNRRSLEDYGVQPDAPVTLKLRHTSVPARTALDVILEQFDLGYVIRDGFIYVVSSEDAADEMYIEVYNVRDLVGEFGEHSHPKAAAHGGDLPVRTAQFGGFGGGFEESEPSRPVTPGERLIRVIESTVGVPWESIVGSGGTIEEFSGLLVVRTSREGHREIKELLKMMRSAHEEQPRGRFLGGPRSVPHQPRSPQLDPPGGQSDRVREPRYNDSHPVEEGVRPRQP